MQNQGVGSEKGREAQRLALLSSPEWSRYAEQLHQLSARWNQEKEPGSPDLLCLHHPFAQWELHTDVRHKGGPEKYQQVANLAHGNDLPLNGYYHGHFILIQNLRRIYWPVCYGSDFEHHIHVLHRRLDVRDGLDVAQHPIARFRSYILSRDQLHGSWFLVSLCFTRSLRMGELRYDNYRLQSVWMREQCVRWIQSLAAILPALWISHLL